MRLADLRPAWISQPDRDGQGMAFDCPCCDGAARLAVAFANPIDGGAPMPLSPGVWRSLLVPEGGPWERAGADFETMTLSPAVDASAAGHWQGSITNGDVV